MDEQTNECTAERESQRDSGLKEIVEKDRRVLLGAFRYGQATHTNSERRTVRQYAFGAPSIHCSRVQCPEPEAKSL